MEKLPQNVINKIMFFTSHPVAEIMKEASIFKVLVYTNTEGEYSDSFMDGLIASENEWGHDPWKWENKTDLELYTLGYEHHYLTRHNEYYYEDEPTLHCRFHIKARGRARKSHDSDSE